jgi:hypothetical protein
MSHTTALVLAALSLGYAVGRLRPWDRLADWADWEIRVRRGAWATTGPRTAALAAAFALTQPGRALHAWRHRNDPPPPKSPPVRVRRVSGGPS